MSWISEMLLPDIGYCTVPQVLARDYCKNGLFINSCHVNQCEKCVHYMMHKLQYTHMAAITKSPILYHPQRKATIAAMWTIQKMCTFKTVIWAYSSYCKKKVNIVPLPQCKATVTLSHTCPEFPLHYTPIGYFHAIVAA